MPFAACFFVSRAALYLVNQSLRINSQKPLYRCTGVSADCAVIPGSSVMLIIQRFSCSRRVGDVCVSYASTCTLAKRLGTARRRDVRLFLAAFVMFSLKKRNVVQGLRKFLLADQVIAQRPSLTRGADILVELQRRLGAAKGLEVYVSGELVAIGGLRILGPTHKLTTASEVFPAAATVEYAVTGVAYHSQPLALPLS